MVLIPLTPRFKQASLSFSTGVDIVHKTGTNAQGNAAIGSYNNFLIHTHTHTASVTATDYTYITLTQLCFLGYIIIIIRT